MNRAAGKWRSLVYHVALVGMMAATLEVSKLALSFLPNIEVTTLLCGLYGYVFGVWGMVATFIFVSIEPMIYGFGPWIVSYLIYWPLVALVFWGFGKLRLKNRVILTATALLLTLFFGILTSAVEVGLFSGTFDRFFYRFGIYYVRGLLFYALQLVCNAVAFPLLFHPLADVLSRLHKRFGRS